MQRRFCRTAIYSRSNSILGDSDVIIVPIGLFMPVDYCAILWVKL